MIKRRSSAIRRVTLPARRVTDVIDKFGRPIIGQSQYTLFDLKSCTVQPYIGEDFVIADTGLQNKKTYVVFTETEVSVGEEDGTQKPDEIFLYDEWYRVVKVRPWQTGVIPHYEVIAVKIVGSLR